MSQQTNNRTVGLVLGILLLVASFWAKWITLLHATLPNGSPLPFDFPIAADGLHGTVTILRLTVPLWLIIALGLLSLGLMLLNLRGLTRLPAIAFVLPAIVSLGYSVAIIVIGMRSHRAGVEIGPILAIAGLLVGLTSGYREATRAS